MDNCNCCFVDYLAKCETEIKLNIILPVYYNYKWVITDKFGNMYEGPLTQGEDGFYSIPVEDLPAGLLTQHSGSLMLQVFQDSTEPCGPEKFIVAGKYDCIDFSISGGTFEKNNLGCEV